MQPWCREIGVSKMDLPSQSTDLNLTEYLWYEFECRLFSQKNRPSSLPALTSAVMNVWESILKATYQKLVNSRKDFSDVCRLPY
ncbi:hypothetical protein TNCV_1259191 [Trichonephila clavipes]|nr:hypothetical protein TNCV_1259191 [Trichonephila clavipes]